MRAFLSLIMLKHYPILLLALDLERALHCEATHRALGVLGFLDSICCFWWPSC